MNKTAELKVLIKAYFRVCQVLNIDKKTHISLSVESINPTHKSKHCSHDDSEIDIIHVKSSLMASLNFYRSLSDFSGGDVAFMNHWLNIENKRFGVPPRELLLTREGIQRLNQYFEDLHISNNQPKAICSRNGENN
jgi:hypothetical protein